MEQGKSKLTVTAILLKIMASAIKEFPQFNSSINMETKEIIYKKYFNVGIAVDTERGLIVPVIKDVDKKNINNLSIEILQKKLNYNNVPYFSGVATKGIGVSDTLKTIINNVIEDIERRWHA